jgi:hypothetical protein
MCGIDVQLFPPLVWFERRTWCIWLWYLYTPHILHRRPPWIVCCAIHVPTMMLMVTRVFRIASARSDASKLHCVLDIKQCLGHRVVLFQRRAVGQLFTWRGSLHVDPQFEIMGDQYQSAEDSAGKYRRPLQCNGGMMPSILQQIATYSRCARSWFHCTM